MDVSIRQAAKSISIFYFVSSIFLSHHYAACMAGSCQREDMFRQGARD